YAMVDRVATTGTVWMGMTTGCCQCHSHKYDPISHTDYYRLFALLNNADEPDQLLPDPAVTARREQLQSQIEQLDQSLLATLQERLAEKQAGATLPDRFAEWFQQEQNAAINWQTVPVLEASSNLPRLEVLEDGSVFSTGDITKRDQFQLTLDTSIFASPITAICLEVMPDDRLPARGPGRAFYEGRQGDFFLSELAATRDGKPLPFADGLVSYGKISIGSGSADAANVFDGDGSTGWSTSGKEGEAHQLLLRFAEPVPAGQSINLSMLFERHFAASLGRFRILATTSTRDLRVPRSGCDLEHQLATFTGKPEDARKQFEKQFLLQVPELNDLQEKRAKLFEQMPEFPTTLVMRERPADNPRPTYRHHRGEFLSPREEVTPAVPLLFPPLPEGTPADRLALARWLVSERNPLAARVAVNRYWQAIFGQGIVSSPGDFGTQSNIPTHPELLDWLASEFIAGNWSRKAILKTIVMSATYRQTSEVSAAVYQADPDNRWLARGPRIRLAAETIRDSLLAASGLLSSKMYGPGVYPPQPQSVTALAYGNVQWNPSTGEDRYRRSLYTFRKRTAPFAAMTTFDAPTGESCTVQRD
ncbi:MAG: DUF1553 domain-containing protein, partial [Planctomycetaceae bacterium]|nr:DUF1553 domain-containing protein [Planctomycetaceae bacterium]